MASKRDSLGDRMKLNYENRSKTYLTRRTPVIIRLDGAHFHSFTRGFAKPFDKRLVEAMQETTLELCKNIQGCVFGYTQSDEITLVLVDYQSLDSEAWFDYGVQKICSTSAALATLYFNRIFARKIAEFHREHDKVVADKETYGDVAIQVEKLMNAYERALKTGATFDSRCFNIPISETVNCILWRQRDCERNSISSLAQAYFSPKKLHGKKSNEMQDMLMEEYGINWNNLATCEKRGACVIKVDGSFVIDTEIPIFTGDGRKYIEDLIIEH